MRLPDDIHPARMHDGFSGPLGTGRRQHPQRHLVHLARTDPAAVDEPGVVFGRPIARAATVVTEPASPTMRSTLSNAVAVNACMIAASMSAVAAAISAAVGDRTAGGVRSFGHSRRPR